MPQDVLVHVNVPDLATKQLRFRKRKDTRVLTISSNWLTLFDFTPGAPVVERSLGPGQGLVIERVRDPICAGGPIKKVYERRYTRRRNNPLETQLEVGSQKLIDQSFPAGCARVHVLFEAGRVTVTPMMTLRDRALENARTADPSSVFAALTSGVDLASMRTEGFSVSAVLEWRPPEARDKADLSETGALAALANSGPLKALFNEDVTSLGLQTIAKALDKDPVFVFHASPQCDDLSVAKGASLKARDWESGETTADMILDLLDVVRAVAPPVVVFENVAGMLSSDAYRIARLRMKRWGYAVHEHLGEARDHGGLTPRKRAYVVFSQLDAPFAFEEATARPTAEQVWNAVAPHLDDCRDVTASKSIQDGARLGRLRRVWNGAERIPTPLKSQERMCKDSLVVDTQDGRYLMPSEGLLKAALGIANVDLSAVSKTIASEILGQSIDAPHHAMVMRAVRRHIAAWRTGAIA